MALSSIGDGRVHNGGGSFSNVGFTTGLILAFLDSFCGPANFFTLAEKFLRVRRIHYACGCLITRADTDMT